MCLTVHINSLSNHETDQSSLINNSYPRFCHHKGSIFVVQCILQPVSRKKTPMLWQGSQCWCSSCCWIWRECAFTPHISVLLFCLQTNVIFLFDLKLYKSWPFFKLIYIWHMIILLANTTFKAQLIANLT